MCRGIRLVKADCLIHFQRCRSRREVGAQAFNLGIGFQRLPYPVELSLHLVCCDIEDHWDHTLALADAISSAQHHVHASSAVSLQPAKRNG